MANGSNDLNLLLKAKVVKIKVELDYKNSGLPAQVDSITKKLANKPVKLKVKLDATLKDLNNQIKGIYTRLNSSKSTQPIKLAVQIDVKGSATQIKKQLQEVYQTVEKFNKQYGKQIQEMQQKTQQVGKNAQSSTSKQMSNLSGMADPSAYTKSLKEAEAYMKNTFGKGIFSSQELKDANGQLVGFTTALTKANGVVQKIRYDWDANASKFVPINQQTVTQTERHVAKALNSLRDLDREIAKLGTNQNKYWKESQALQSKSLNGTLTQDAVNSLKTRIKEEQALQSAINKENSLLREQKELLAQINKAQKEAKSNRVKTELGNLKSNVSSVNLDGTDAKNQLNDIKSSFNSLKSSYNDQIKKEKELKSAYEKRLEILSQIAKLEKTINLSNGKGAGSARYVAETKELAKNIKTMEQYNEVRKRMNATNREVGTMKVDNQIEKQLDRLKNSMFSFATATGRSQKTIEDRFAQVSHAVKGNLQSVMNEIDRYDKLLTNFKNKQALEQRRSSVVANADHKTVSNLVSAKDNNALKEYIANLNGAQVAMMRLTTDSKGVSRITAQFASTKKTAKEVTYEIDQVDKKLRQLSSAEVFNANRNLGVFEQLKIAIARVPVWMTAMTAFYGSIRSIKAVTNEILTLDKSLTELRRVADAGINIDHLFQGSIDLSKELGNNIHDVMQAVNDMARTFGEFNERQLLAITRTATLMSNVSDLTAQEATESLVGTMNAFNITAEESIRIVDSMNEVDNNYAISTKQLATGLAKSASTAKTFGATMEENIGAITAIGAVTMESGNVIGNSLKTIYSRLTTMSGARDALAEVGVSVTDLATGDIRRVGDIIEDLGYKWNDLSNAQRQNIGVQVAGRYQLSRFLAYMNNFDMAVEATKTALTSQGSAIRENEQYMKSFEARINQLKNGFTELSSSIGEAFLSSGLSVLISGLTSMAEASVKVVDVLGILPVVLGVVGVALLKFGVLDKMVLGIAGALRTAQVAFTTTSARATMFGTAMARSTAVASTGFAGLRAGAVATATTVRASFASMLVAVKTFSTGFKLAIASTGIGLAFVALGFIIEKLIKMFSDAKAEQEELINTNKKMVDSYRASGDGMDFMYKEYSRLMQKKNENIELTKKEQDQLELLTAQFAGQLPTVVDYYNESGEAILKNTDKIKEQIEYAKQLSKEQAKLDEINFSKNLKDGSKDYVKTLKETQKARKKLAELEEDNGKLRYTGQGENFVIDNTKAIQEQIIKVLGFENELSSKISDVTKVIQEQSLAYFEATGKMSDMTDEQIRLIETFSSVNDEYLRNAGDAEAFAERSVQLTESSKHLGNVFSEAFEIMSRSISNKPEELEKLKDSLSMVAKSIPKDFLKIDENNYEGSMFKITQGTKEFINVSSQVKSNANANFEELAQRLVEAGFTAGEAELAVTKLSIQHQNLGLKQQAQAQNADMVTQATNEMNEAMLESIDVIAEVFGYESGEFSALKQQIELMEVLRERYGETATQTQAYKDAQTTLAGALGVSAESIEANVHDYNLAFQALQDLKVVTDEQGGSYLNFAEITKGMTKEQKDLVSAILEAKGTLHEIPDSISGASGAMEDMKKSVIDTRESIKEPFDLQVKPIDTQFNRGLQDLINAQTDMRKLVHDSSATVTKTVEDVNKSGENLGKTKDNIDKVSKSTEELDKKTKTASGNMSTSFTDMSTSVTEKTKNMINKHDSQRDAINRLASSARNAKSDISNMNSDILDSMNTLSRFQSKLSTANSFASNAKNNFSMNSYSKESLLPAYNGASDSVSESISTFTATSDSFSNSSNYSGGGEGTSGIIKQPNNSIAERFEALHNTIGSSGGYYAYKNGSSGTSKASTVKKTTTAKTATEKAKEANEKAEQLAELYVVDMLNRKRLGYEGTLNSLKGKISGLSENTKIYRDSLQQVYNQQNEILKLDREELALAMQKDKELQKRISALANTNKHTKEQREEYNKLQQDYDSNLSKITSLRGSIENSIVELRKTAESVFLDFVDEIIDNFDKSISAIKDRIDNLDFKMEVLELTDPDDVAGKIDILVDKTLELVRERAQLEAERKRLEEDAVTATAKYGANSEAVKKLTDKLKENSEAWEDVTISILRAEKEVRDIRGDMADKIINLVKDSYTQMKKSATDAIDTELKALKKAHEEKVKIYDAEIKKINEIYDAKLKSLDKEKNEDDYEKEKYERTLALAELQKKEASYSRDDTLEGRKKYAEIKKEREKAQEELDEFIKDRQLELLKEQLNVERESLLEGLEGKKEIESESNDIKIESLEQEKEAVSEHYDSIIEDEKKWASIREELIKGNFGVINSELENMGITLEQSSNGIFNTLSMNFASYSEQVRNFVNEINSMVGQINAVTNTPSIGTQNGVGIGSMMTPYQTTEVIRKAKNNIQLDIPTPDKNNLYELIKNTSIPEVTLNNIFDKASKGEAMIAPTTEKQMFYDLFLEIIGKKAPRFNTGGYTGDWAGNGAKIGLLDKKELILKEGQTRDILDAVKLLGNISNLVSVPVRNIPRVDSVNNVGSGITNNYELVVEIDKLNGDKGGADLVVKEIMKGLKKLGR